MRILSRQVLIDKQWQQSVRNPQLATQSNWESITYGDGIFLAKSGTYLSTSTNGTDWSAPYDAMQGDPYGRFYNTNFLAYGNGVFVALGRGTTLYTSTDAINWSIPVSGRSIYSDRITDLIFDGEKFIALDEKNSDVWTSTDGEDWTEKEPVTGYLTGAVQIAFDGNKYVVSREDGYGNISTSTDLLNWTETRVANFAVEMILNYDGLRFFGVKNEQISYSNDGINWTRPITNTNLGNHSWKDSISNGSKIVLISSDGYISTKRV